MLETLTSKLKGWFTRTKKSKDEDEFVPLELLEMNKFCLHSYLETYTNFVFEGSFQSGTNVLEIVDSFTHVVNSLSRCAIHTQGNGSRTVFEKVHDLKYKEVCQNFPVYTTILSTCNFF